MDEHRRFLPRARRRIPVSQDVAIQTAPVKRPAQDTADQRQDCQAHRRKRMGRKTRINFSHYYIYKYGKLSTR